MKKRDAVFFPSRLDYYFVSSQNKRNDPKSTQKEDERALFFGIW
jgi:hypothetical protein